MQQNIDAIVSYPTKLSAKALVQKNDYIDLDISKITPAKLAGKKTTEEMRAQEAEIVKAKR